MNFDCPFVDVRVGWQPPGSRSSHRLGLRLPAILLLALVLANCGGGPRSTGYADRPPSDRVAYTAWQEWTRFGRSTVVYGGHAGGYVNRSGLSERSEPLASKIADYWGTSGHPHWTTRTTTNPSPGTFFPLRRSHSGTPPSPSPP